MYITVLTYIRKILFSAVYIFVFGVIIPVWIASVKAESLQTLQPETTLAEPVARLVGNTRKLLLSRLEATRQKNRAVQVVPIAQGVIWSGVESNSTFAPFDKADAYRVV